MRVSLPLNEKVAACCTSQAMYGPVVDLYRLVKNVLGLGWKQGALLLAQLCSTLRMHVLGHPLHTLIEVRKITAACLLNCSSIQGDTVGQCKRQRAFWDHVSATVNKKSELKHGVTPHLSLVEVATSRPDPACIDTRRVQRWTKGECPAAWVALLPPPQAPQPRQASQEATVTTELSFPAASRCRLQQLSSSTCISSTYL